MKVDIEKASAGREHIVILDGFRGLAILLVIAMHYIGFMPGWTGVDLFFVLSGFLITWKLVQSIDKNSYYFDFYRKRILRICPLYFGVLVFVFFLFPLLKPSLITTSYRELVQIQIWYWTFTQNFYNACNGWPENISIVHFWSLATEMQFYLVWPFIIRLFYKRTQQMIGLLLVLVLVAVLFRLAAQQFIPVSQLYRYVLLPSRVDAFALGALVFLLTQQYSYWFKKFVFIIAVTGTVVNIFLYLCLFSIGYTAFFTSRFGYTLIDITWAAWIGYGLLSGKNNFIQKIFTNRFLVTTGKYSYAIYVFHLPVFTMVNRIVSDHYEQQYKGTPAVMVLLPLIVFMGVYLLSITSFHFYEKHFLRIKATI